MQVVDIKKLVLEVLRDIQELSGREWKDLEGRARPIGSLEGFDSLNGIEATAEIEKRLGRSLKLETVFVDEKGKRATSIDEICARVAGAVEKGAAA